MKNQDKTKEVLIKELQKLQQEKNSLQTLYDKELIRHKQLEQKFIIANNKKGIQKEEIEKQAEANQSNRGTNEYLESLFRYGNAPIIVWDRHFNITDFNPAFETLTGRKADEVIGHSVGILFPPDLVKNSMELIRKTQEGKHRETFEVNIFHVNGTSRTIILNSTNVLGKDGKTIIATIAQGKDITLRIQAQELLRETKGYLESLFRYGNAPIIVSDTQFNILDLNPAFEALTGRKADEAIGNSIEILFPSDSVETSMELIRKTRKGKSLENAEIDILHVNGSVSSVLWNSANVLDIDGKTVIATIAQGLDITERKQVQEKIITANKELVFQNGIKEKRALELVIANKELAFQNQEKEKRAAELIIANKELAFQNEEKEKRAAELVIANKELALQNIEKEKRVKELDLSNKELEQFAYVATHDLQEPLRMISSYTQLLERKYKDKIDDDANVFIHYAVDGAIRMQKLINDMLDYSRVSNRGKDFEQVDATVILRHVISNLHLLIMENRALITSDDLPLIKADESQILRVFQNLIENAIKFKKKTDPPRIHISCRNKNNIYEFSVKDNGIGIEKQYHDRVFIIFQRLHSIKDYPGTGIGLSINKRIIERHGGMIWFDSVENEGTTFYFTLPA